jgi:hypothetical protein
MNNKITKIILEIPQSMTDDIENIMKISKMSKVDVLRRSINLFKLLVQKEKEGNIIQIENRATGKIQELTVIKTC